MNQYLAHIRSVIYVVTICLALTLQSAAHAANTAGTVELVDGTVWVQGVDNKIRSIEAEQPLYEGDTIITGKDGELQARMQDEAIIAVRANTKLKIESYRAEGDEEDNAVFSLLLGTFRSVTGWIGKYNRKNYAIKTTAATIGVRGTDHEPMYIPPPVPGMKPLGEPGVYDKVNSGRIVIKNRYGESEFGQGQAGFVGLKSQRAAIRLNQVPEFFKTSRHEKRIIKSKKRLHKRLNERLVKKQQNLQKQQRTTTPNKPLPKLLNIQPGKGGFVPNQNREKDSPGKRLPQQTRQPDHKPLPGQLIKRPLKPVPMQPVAPAPKTFLQPQLPDRMNNIPDKKTDSRTHHTRTPVTKQTLPVTLKPEMSKISKDTRPLYEDIKTPEDTLTPQVLSQPQTNEAARSIEQPKLVTPLNLK